MGIPCKRLMPKRINSWPSCLWLIEPDYDYCEYSDGTTEFWCDRWFYAKMQAEYEYLPSDGCIHQSADMVQAILQSLEYTNRIVVAGHGMESIMILLQVSKHFSEHGFTCDTYFAANGRAFVSLINGKQKVVFVDIQNWLPGELEDMARWCNCHVPEVSRWWPDNRKNTVYHQKVLYALSMGLLKYKTFVEQNGLGGFTYSLSSLGFGYWSRQNEAAKVMKPRSKEEGEIESQAHYGGFCVAHKMGQWNTERYYLCDCNGLYGTVLRDKKLPYRHVTTRWHVEPGDLDRAALRGDYIVKGTFELNNGFLPYKSSRQIYWSHGPITGWLCGPEVRWIREYGKIHSIDSIMVYDTDYITSETSSYFLQQRFLAASFGESYEKLLWKFIQNSLYGKTAQRFGESQSMPVQGNEKDGVELFVDYKTGQVWRVVVFCGTKLLVKEEGGGNTWFPSIAAFVTSYARVRLWEICSMAGWENVFYNDTDSLIVNSQGYERIQHLIGGNIPGMLKIESQGIHCDIRGPKRYSVGDKVVDGTAPNFFLDGGRGVMSWVERDHYKTMAKRDLGIFVAKKRFRKVWDEAYSSRVKKIYSAYDFPIDDIPF